MYQHALHIKYKQTNKYAHTSIYYILCCFVRIHDTYSDIVSKP